MRRNNAFSEVKELLNDNNQLESKKEPETKPEPEAQAQEKEEVPEVATSLENQDEKIDDSNINEEQQEAKEGEEGDTPYNITSLAKAIGWETPELYDVEVPMGEGLEPVKLGALKDQYQISVNNNKAAEAKIAEQEEALKSAGQSNYGQQNLSMELQQAIGQVELIDQQYSITEWDEIEKANPGQAALLRQKFAEAKAQAQVGVQQAEQNMSINRQSYLSDAHAKMMNMIPAWKNPATLQSDQNDIRIALRNEGYADETITAIDDPIMMKLLVELVGYRKLSAEAKETIKKVKKVPKVINPAGRNQSSKIDDIATKKEAVRIAKPGEKRQVELEAVKAILGGGLN